MGHVFRVFGSIEYQYTGEVNGVGDATGWGIATGKHGKTMTGTFLNDLPEGIIIESLKTG